ncbi:hypothetical protein ETB97_006436 [Aspergillus alliaceus]|uniref:Xylanolytic transcriptional activator regulatory domain-containing protein n=1 Tax=Petromyces alliaceus TaxID=209559 RepID=A0A8H6E2J5_PETAA|nr:hypothetical protein ETB97_006436 [Aspergillus burnettii]
MKAGISCHFPEPKRAPRKLNRPPVRELLKRLRQLEEEIEHLRSARPAIDDSVTPSAHSELDRHHTYQTPRPIAQETPLGKLTVKEGKSRYVDEEASVALGNQVEELQDLVESSSDEDSYPSNINAGPFGLPQSGLFGIYSPNWSFGTFRRHYLQPTQVEALWRIYQDNVAPLVAILYKPTLAQIVQNATSGVTLDYPSEAPLLSVCFAAVASVKPEQCPSLLGQDYNTAFHDYKFAFICFLQAAVLFLLCFRVGGDTRLTWAASAVVIRVAQGQGVHRDGQKFGLSPFDTEIRRRLWWHICILDMLSSEDQGIDTQIQLGTFDTQLPTNVDGNELTPDITELPPGKPGFTDITICIIMGETFTNLYWPRRSLSKVSEMSSSDRENHVKIVGERIHQKYIDHFDLDIPIHWVSAMIARLHLSKEWLAVHFQTSSGGLRDPELIHDDIVFYTAVELVKFAYLLQINEDMTRWSCL